MEGREELNEEVARRWPVSMDRVTGNGAIVPNSR